ncbi:hypothetical protein ACSSV1_001213 [Labrenzia sp. MBR-25]
MTFEPPKPSVTEDVVNGNEFGERTFANAWELWFSPEIEHRKITGRLPDKFQLVTAQVLFPIEGDARILLNEEVTGTARMRCNGPVEAGDPVFLTTVQEFLEFDLRDELLDHGHFTIIRSRESWHIFFNFLTGRAKARDTLQLAQQFFDAASFSKKSKHVGPTIDNLFSAAELISKAELILHQFIPRKTKKHSTINGHINLWSRLGNIDAAFVSLFNKLGQQRPNARYGDSKHQPPMPEQESFELIQAMIDRGLDKVKRSNDLG